MCVFFGSPNLGVSKHSTNRLPPILWRQRSRSRSDVIVIAHNGDLAGLQSFPSPKSQDIGHVVEESATNGGAVGAMPKPEDVGMFQM